MLLWSRDGQLPLPFHVLATRTTTLSLPLRHHARLAALLLVLLAPPMAGRAVEPGAGGSARPAGDPTHPELRAELTSLFQRDQAARKALLRAIREAGPAPASSPYALEVMPLVRDVQAIDAESTAFLQALIATRGWPTFEMVGMDGAESAWLLAQHADAHPELQEQVLALMRPAAAVGQAERANLAYLEDRVLVAKREPQLYGTQFGTDGSGVQRPFPVADPARLDERRASMGLTPLSQHLKQLRKMSGGRVKPEPLETYPAP